MRVERSTRYQRLLLLMVLLLQLSGIAVGTDEEETKSSLASIERCPVADSSPRTENDEVPRDARALRDPGDWSVVRRCVPTDRPRCRYDPVEERFPNRHGNATAGWRVVHQKATLCLVSDRLGLIFVAIPKNGFGTTETFMRHPQIGARRTSWSELTDDQRANYFVFAFVRDPVERSVSAYNQAGILKRGPAEFQAEVPGESELGRFRRFFRAIEEHQYQDGLPANGWDEHVPAQTVFLAGLNGWPVHLDLVAPLREMSGVWSWFREIGALPAGVDVADLPRQTNAASRNRGKNMIAYELLEEQDHEMLRRVYRKDYDCLGPFLPPPRADPARNAERDDEL